MKPYHRKSETTHHIIVNDPDGCYYYNGYEEDDIENDYYDSIYYRGQLIEYEYEGEDIKKTYAQRSRFGIRNNVPRVFGYRKIDMMSIYSKERIREKKIDSILGIEDLSNTFDSILADRGIII